MCASMVDIQSPTAEIRRRKKERKKERRRNHRMKIYMACPITWGGHKSSTCLCYMHIVTVCE